MTTYPWSTRCPIFSQIEGPFWIHSTSLTSLHFTINFCRFDPYGGASLPPVSSIFKSKYDSSTVGQNTKTISYPFIARFLLFEMGDGRVQGIGAVVVCVLEGQK